MKISFNSRKNSLEETDSSHGFGYATHGMLKALVGLNFNVAFNCPTADVGIVFNHPEYAQFYPHQYNILYFPWESTQVKPGWVDVMNSVDEVWTPSPWCAGVLMSLTSTPVYVYEHGVEHTWSNRRRQVEDKFHFLHVGAEAARKNGWDVVRAFRQAFPGNEEVELTLKMFGNEQSRMQTAQLNQFGHSRIHYFNEDWGLTQLQQRFWDSHVYVYPSAGEGFGLTPLQALATGMPTITLAEWAPYADLLDPDLTLPGTLVASSWDDIHPGKVYRFQQDDLIDRMRFAYYYYDGLAQSAYDLGPKVHERYDWRRVTESPFRELQKRLK